MDLEPALAVWLLVTWGSAAGLGFLLAFKRELKRGLKRARPVQVGFGEGVHDLANRDTCALCQPEKPAEKEPAPYDWLVQQQAGPRGPSVIDLLDPDGYTRMKLQAQQQEHYNRMALLAAQQGVFGTAYEVGSPTGQPARRFRR